MDVKKININQTEPTYYIASDIYDVSARNNGATFESLSSLLSSDNLSTLIPSEIRCGGMTICFIQSSDNKYVQYRYMGTEITGTPNPFLDTTNWQGVDDEPIAGSDNLVKSGGVYENTKKLSNINIEILQNCGEKDARSSASLMNRRVLSIFLKIILK